ncbi:MAG: UvrD-helicase domain-containing protein, partial [Desulfovibrionaceae bacterium]|nr:UvrD-helicase domain-containing protein [Desulfovibrionaceae bacterium]
QSFLGTIEFFPEEGKYHLDGHRKCGVVMDPQESRARGGICPVCGRPVTMGVLSRILELADREEPVRPPNRPGFASLIPLKELIAEVLGAGPGTKKVLALYNRITADLGPELDVLQIVPAEDIAKYSRPLAEGVGRMREGRVLRTPGFDGQYGVISVFTDKERAEMTRGGLLIAPAARAEPLAGPVPDQAPRARETAPSALVHNPAQERAVLAGPNPVLVVAGPGTGKTQTLAGRVERLLGQGVDPKKILVVTFTRRAAQELRDRLRARLGPDISPPQAGTLHALAFDYWSHVQGEPPVVLDEESAKRVFAEANPKLPKSGLKAAWEALCLARQTMRPQDPDLAAAAANYSGHKSSWNLADYDDLLAFMLEQIASNGFAAPFSHVLVDEIQDLSALQLALVSSVARDDGKGFFAIGDPRQSIYGFRGALGDARAALKRRWPDIEVVELEDNYRSAQAILDLSGGLFPDAPRLRAQNDAPAEIHLFQAPDAMREAAWIAARVKSLIGATSHSLADATGHGGLAPGDVAVLVRFRGLTAILEKALTRQGVPCARPEAEAFWDDPRAAAILAAAGRFLGLPGKEDNGPDIPEPVLAGGPAGLASALRETPPFDRFFWEGRAFRELKRAFEQKRGWAGLLNWVHLQSGLELIGRSAEKVQIMSLHAAKGLEFEAVFMPCLEDGVLPFFGAETLTGKAPESVPGQAAVLEEKRLFYVGLTRARQMLFMSHAASRTLYGRTLRLPPSRFLGELAPKLIKRTAMTAHSVKKEKRLSLLDTPSARTS